MKTLLCAGAVLAPLCAVAATAAEPTQLDPIVITATGREQPLSETLAPLLVLTREQIEQAQAFDLAELLRFFAGVELGRNGGIGSTTSVFVRGGESNHTLVLIDGVRVNPATSGGAALQNIAPEMIERIEVVKGPRASLYGSDAIAAVVNVITRKAGAGRRADGSVRIGSNHSFDGSLRAGYAGERGSFGVQAQHLTTDGFPAHVELDDDTGYRRSSVNLDGSLKLGRAELDARLWDARGEVEYYAFVPEPAEQDYRNQVAALELRAPLTRTLAGRLRASRMEDDIDQRDSADFVETVRSSVDSELSWSGAAHRLSGGISATREDVEALSFGSAIEEQRDILVLRAQDEFRSGRHRAVLGASWSDYEGFGDRVDGNLDYGFDLAPGTRLVGAAGTGFRAPDATDRYGFGGNPDLEPEEARNYELGLQQFFGGRHQIDLRLFRSDVEDLITVVCDENFECTAINVDRYRNEGVELTYRLQWQQWSGTLTGLLQDPVDRTSGTQLLRRAKRSAALHLSRRFGEHFAGLEVLGSESRPDFATELGGYVLVNLTAGLQLAPWAQLRARVENLLDKRYQTAAGYNQQDLAGFVTLALRY